MRIYPRTDKQVSVGTIKSGNTFRRDTDSGAQYYIVLSNNSVVPSVPSVIHAVNLSTGTPVELYSATVVELVNLEVVEKK